jgi:formylglycine-generating enzyme required for sulfatase activity
MAHDVFISHSKDDKPYADAVCAKLESRNIRCWIAPRNIRPGMTWAGAIIEAVDGARVMLLLFSSHANESQQVSREVEYAVQKQIVIVPVKVEDVIPTGDFAYFLATPHWLDAITPPFEQHLDQIADDVSFWLERVASDASTETPLSHAGHSQSAHPQRIRAEPPIRAAAATGPAPSRPKLVIPAVVALAIAALGTLGFFATRYYRGELSEARRFAERGATAHAHPTAGSTFRDCDDCPEMVIVPGGSFTMGSPASEVGRSENEGPQHLVTFDYDFAVSKYPITRDEFAQFVSETKYDAGLGWQNPGVAQSGRHPVVNISWDNAKAYMAWLSDKTGRTYRLLSESEYEYAERAGTTTAYWWGDRADQLCSHANGGGCGHNGTIPVGSYPPNGFGLYDMAGNAWDWTDDCWHDNYVGAPADGTAWTTGERCAQRVLRGDSWHGLPKNLRSASRNNYSGWRYDRVGFRVARTL